MAIRSTLNPSEGSKSLSISALSATESTNACCPAEVFPNLEEIRNGATITNSFAVDS